MTESHQCMLRAWELELAIVSARGSNTAVRVMKSMVVQALKGCAMSWLIGCLAGRRPDPDRHLSCNYKNTFAHTRITEHL